MKLTSAQILKQLLDGRDYYEVSNGDMFAGKEPTEFLSKKGKTFYAVVVCGVFVFTSRALVNGDILIVERDNEGRLRLSL